VSVFQHWHGATKGFRLQWNLAIHRHCKAGAERNQVQCHCCNGKAKKFGKFKNSNRNVQRYRCERCSKTFSETQPLDGMRVDFKQACQVVHMLVEGMGVRAIERIIGMHRDTVLSVLEMAGQKAAAFLDANVQNVNAGLIQADEIHSFVYSKQQNTDDRYINRGEQFTFLAVDRQSKLIVSSLVGKRTRENAYAFLSDLKKRMANQFQLTTDNWQVYSGYEGAVRSVFGWEVDYATETKIFANPVPYLPRRVTGIRRKARIGCPDMQLATTCHAERTNLSVRLFTRRFTRCTLGYSKTVENLRHAVALFVWHFNFCRIHSAHGQTPAQEARIAKNPMTIEELLSATNS
jgi:transposase-like protein/IS1 family transposase